jgi:cellobiose phosphorylase
MCDSCPATGAPDVTQAVLAGEADFQAHELRSASGLTVKVLPSGCIYAIERGAIQIDQVLGSPIAGGIHRLFLRLHLANTIEAHEIIGPKHASAVSTAADRIVWRRSIGGVDCSCTCWLHPSGDGWFFHVQLDNRTARPFRADVVMVQDLGLASRGQVRNNELFTSQYLDHTAIQHAELGYVLMTRQNLPQPPRETHPWLMQGCFPQAAGFTSDGFDFFSAAYRGGSVPCALTKPSIGTRVRQYEMAYTAIQSTPLDLDAGKESSCTFFAHFAADHPSATSAVDLERLSSVNAMRDDLLRALKQNTQLTPVHRVQNLFESTDLFAADEWNDGDLRRWFPQPRRHEEFAGHTLHSFFHGEDARHVVLRGKEIATARPHGHILRAGRGFTPAEELMSCTCYAAGAFASQLTLGNTSLAKLLSGVRDPLNIVRSGGLRIFVRLHPSETWQLLGVPSAFEMALDECRWIYKSIANELTVRCRAADAEPVITFDLHATGAPIEWLICGEVAAGPAEFESSPTLTIDPHQKQITVRPDPRSILGERQPELTFQIVTPTPDAVGHLGGDELLFADHVSRRLPYFVIQTRPTTSFTFSFAGKPTELPREQASETWRHITAGVLLKCDSSQIAQQIQDTLQWFARDALVHLSCPRGLEQANGGAWGVRDVCQGPVEFLLSYGHTDIIADILRRLFAQQYHGRGDWPQWFMFPPYQSIQSPHCHGDVLIWPLKALCDYLEDSNDASILHKRLPYTDERTFQPTDAAATMLEHADRLIAKMRRDFLPGISLPRYGDGDWDDSLQPADPMLRERMVSSWTSALMFQTLRRYARALAHFGEDRRAGECSELAERIDADFHRHLMPDGIVAGFAVFNGGNAAEYLLHPRDTRTGLRYRLIPMSRGIISGIFSPEEAARHLDHINEHLLYPDGARLMDRPTTYDGGRERTFRRSESAAFFGREIGLQYVHAHLRYAEALAVMGRGDELLRALRVVNPIAVTEVVPNARPRQRNCYFSSSDAAFRDRYDAAENYGKLRDGQVPVDGGWRIYSSGPGIYTGLVMRHLLGIRRHFEWLEFDPVLGRELNGVSCGLTQAGRTVEYQINTAAGDRFAARLTVNGQAIKSVERIPHRYRPGGWRCLRAELQRLLTLPKNVVQIDL